jgi:DNA-binding phage protein
MAGCPHPLANGQPSKFQFPLNQDKQVAAELPELIERHYERMAALDQLGELVAQLKAAREAKGLSLSDVEQLTGMDRSALSKLENGQRANPTVETLVRYAEALGKRLVVSLADAREE